MWGKKKGRVTGSLEPNTEEADDQAALKKMYCQVAEHKKKYGLI